MRLLTILILLTIAANLNAQSRKTTENWLEINNLFFKNKDVLETRLLIPGDSSLLVHDELSDHQLSFGFSLRKVKKNGSYHQFDLLEMNWVKDRNSRTVENINHQHTEPTWGRELKEVSALIGYQRGKLLPIKERLIGDIGFRGSVWYKRRNKTPANSAGFPVREKLAGLGLNLEIGLNYQIHKRINIGYNFIPFTIKGFWNEEYVDNPILPERQKIINKGIEVDIEFLESVINLRNFSIRYVF